MTRSEARFRFSRNNDWQFDEETISQARRGTNVVYAPATFPRRKRIHMEIQCMHMYVHAISRSASRDRDTRTRCLFQKLMLLSLL